MWVIALHKLSSTTAVPPAGRVQLPGSMDCCEGTDAGHWKWACVPDMYAQPLEATGSYAYLEAG